MNRLKGKLIDFLARLAYKLLVSEDDLIEAALAEPEEHYDKMGHSRSQPTAGPRAETMFDEGRN